MDYQTWRETIQNGCKQIRSFGGVSNCYDPKNRISLSCAFDTCPKIEERLP
jgi:hypothetical protein